LTLTRICAAGLAVVMGAAQLSSVLLAADPVAERFWPQWRGPYASGVSRSADPPVEWSETKHIRWKIEIPGRGSSSPVVWGDRLFVLTAIPMGAAAATSHDPRGQVQPRPGRRGESDAVELHHLVGKERQHVPHNVDPRGLLKPRRRARWMRQSSSRRPGRGADQSRAADPRLRTDSSSSSVYARRAAAPEDAEPTGTRIPRDTVTRS